MDHRHKTGIKIQTLCEFFADIDDRKTVSQTGESK